VGTQADMAIAATGNPSVIEGLVARSPVPMLVVDSERRFIDANRPARLAFRVSLAELRGQLIEDLTPPHLLPVMHDAWGRLMDTGCVAGPYEVATPDGSLLSVSYFALADVLPDRHLIMFAPAGWPETELIDEPEEPAEPLTAREREILQLAADGRSAPVIARELFLSPATVSTHFSNIYVKLRVRDRAAAVARGMRLGLIG
jgi:DNA-binding CsgD family transcriptional regulator